MMKFAITCPPPDSFDTGDSFQKTTSRKTSPYQHLQVFVESNRDLVCLQKMHRLHSEQKGILIDMADDQLQIISCSLLDYLIQAKFLNNIQKCNSVNSFFISLAQKKKVCLLKTSTWSYIYRLQPSRSWRLRPEKCIKEITNLKPGPLSRPSVLWLCPNSIISFILNHWLTQSVPLILAVPCVPSRVQG